MATKNFKLRRLDDHKLGVFFIEKYKGLYSNINFVGEQMVISFSDFSTDFRRHLYLTIKLIVDGKIVFKVNTVYKNLDEALERVFKKAREKRIQAL